tara:strand:- start:378 stop:614 length:237 start_codon:yes stop_codon:yes gene_type:complete
MIQIKEKIKKGEVTKKEVLAFIKTRKRTNPWDKKSLDSIAKWVKNYVPGRTNATCKKKNVAKKKAQTIDPLAWLKDGF